MKPVTKFKVISSTIFSASLSALVFAGGKIPVSLRHPLAAVSVYRFAKGNMKFGYVESLTKTSQAMRAGQQKALGNNNVVGQDDFLTNYAMHALNASVIDLIL